MYYAVVTMEDGGDQPSCSLEIVDRAPFNPETGETVDVEKFVENIGSVGFCGLPGVVLENTEERTTVVVYGCENKVACLLWGICLLLPSLSMMGYLDGRWVIDYNINDTDPDDDPSTWRVLVSTPEEVEE